MMRKAIVSIALLPLCLGCASWEVTRTTVVDPVNALLHHEYPAALRDESVDRFTSLWVRDTAAEARRAAAELLDGFEKVDTAQCILDTVSRETSAGEIRVQAEVRLSGRDRASRRRSVRQRREILCQRSGDGWRIARDELLETMQTRGGPAPAFRNEAHERGVSLSQQSRGVVDRTGCIQRYLPGSGVTVRDVNADGFEDLLFVNGGQLHLLINHEGEFRDESQDRGILAPAVGECRYGIFGDVDNDGDGDLYVGVLDGESVLFVDEGGGYFRGQDASAFGIRSSGENTGAAFADFDGDGDLDLFVVNGGNLLRKLPEPIYNAQNGGMNRLFLNRGDGTFVDATANAGVGDTGWGLACTTGDYDRDGDTDLFVANDLGRDRLYRNRGDATFEEISSEAGIHHLGSSMGAAFGDINGDGHLDLFVSGMASNSAWILDQPGFPTPAPWFIKLVLRSRVLEMMKEMLHGNRLYLSQGDGTFIEVSTETETANSGWSWGGVFLDYDNDGYQDIYVVNGLISGTEKDDL